MQKKFDKLSSIATLILIFLAFLNQLFLPDYNKYTANLETTNTLLDNKMVERCVNIGDTFNVSMSIEGLNGQCGFLAPEYNSIKKCYVVKTYGENISGQKTAEILNEVIKNKPEGDYHIFHKRINKNLVSTILIFLALFFQFLAIIMGFKKNPFSEIRRFLDKYLK